MDCKFCMENTYHWELISPCNCIGTNGHVHLHCLLKWLWVSGTTWCPVCKTDFKNKELWYVVTMVSMVCNIILSFSAIIYEYLFKHLLNN